MKRLLIGPALLLALTACGGAWARTEALAPSSSGAEARPGVFVSEGGTPAAVPARYDTLNFGYYDPGTGYAVLGETWTWDHGGPDPLEGWTSVDGSVNPVAYFRRITADTWQGHENQVPVPLIAGQGSAWLGAFEDEADALCWTHGLGYGNLWCQRLVSPVLDYSGSGGITLRLKYFNDSEADDDYTKIFLDKGPVSIPLNESAPDAHDGFNGPINIDCTPLPCVVSIPAQPWERIVSAAEMGGAGSFTLRIQFESDGGWSDEDGFIDSALGPFGFDDLTVSGGTAAAYAFETGLDGWTPGICPAVGSYFAVHPLSMYSLPDPCTCALSGNVVAFHDPTLQHPEGQKEGGFSNIVDRTNYLGHGTILADWDMYADLPMFNGVFYRPGWDYYPYVCPSSGETGWSGRQGQDSWYYVGDTPECRSYRNVATAWGIPTDCQYIRFVYEVYADCEAFGIPPTECTDSNFSPLVDNVRVRLTQRVDAPPILFGVAARFQDGFQQDNHLSTNQPGNADISYDTSHGNTAYPCRLGDSLTVTGPAPDPQGTNRWESRLWFRVKREGPAQHTIPRYNTWLYRVKDDRSSIVGAHAPFTFGWMDSVETVLPLRNVFCSQFHERDDDFAPGPPGREYDQGEDNEILWDHIFTPGTKIEYFVTSNYTCTPGEMYLLPDTTGGAFEEFEILPGYRMDGGVAKFPCLLYVHADESGYGHGALSRRGIFQNALNQVLAGAPPGSPIPEPAVWDTYDYLYATFCCSGAMFRRPVPGSTNGATLAQLLGYRAILVGTGGLELGLMEREDFEGLEDWLTTTDCESNVRRQGLILNGENLAETVNDYTPSILQVALGTRFRCSDYSLPTCPSGDPDNDENQCVRLEPAPGGPWVPDVPVDVFGNWCPTRYSYDVLATSGTGVGNKVYQKIGGVATEFAQITNAPAGPYNYRSVVDGFSYHHMTVRDLGNPGPASECPSDAVLMAQAASTELRQALRWTLNTEPLQLGLCRNPCALPASDVTEGSEGGGPVFRLEQNRPNPFNPRTAIQYSLAVEGPARLTIFDVNGRVVRTLVNARQEAGRHETVWDGADDAGRPVGSGIYWSQLSAGEYKSNRKMVVLK